jgi:hypothetical protein
MIKQVSIVHNTVTVGGFNSFEFLTAQRRGALVLVASWETIVKPHRPDGNESGQMNIERMYAR